MSRIKDISAPFLITVGAHSSFLFFFIYKQYKTKLRVIAK